MPITRPASRVRAERALRGVTQAALARTVGVSPATMSAIENGDRTPSLSLVAKLAEALDCDPQAISPEHTVPETDSRTQAA